MTNINEARAEELAEIEGVSPELAEEIVRYRTEHGRIGGVEDLMGIDGVSEKTAMELDRHIRY